MYCDGQGAWYSYCALASVYQQTIDYLRTKEGRCGYKSFIMNALVSAEAQQIVVEGGSSTADPLNDVEVAWISSGGEMYQLQDIPGQIAPLSNPFYDTTNERGLSQIKYRLPLPNGYGYSIDLRSNDVSARLCKKEDLPSFWRRKKQSSSWENTCLKSQSTAS